MTTKHDANQGTPHASNDLEQRIMHAVRATPRPMSRGRIRARRFTAIGGGGLLASAVAFALVATIGFEQPSSPPSDSHSPIGQLPDPPPQLVADWNPAALWQIHTDGVSAFTETVDGASGEATRTALSLISQAGSGLRAFAPPAAGKVSPEDVRSDSSATRRDTTTT